MGRAARRALLLGLTLGGGVPIFPQKLFEEQLKKYDQLKVYLEQNLAAQDNVLRALTEANVQYAAVRRVLSDLDQKSVPALVVTQLRPELRHELASVGRFVLPTQVELHTTDPGSIL